jgi:hypothetical protein
VQHGLQVRLEVFKSADKGWGVRPQKDIAKAGTLVAVMYGQIIRWVQAFITC